jgi:hypothetical protein
MGLLVFLLMIAIIVELRYKPRYKKVGGESFIEYNLHRYTKERDSINLSQIFNKH